MTHIDEWIDNPVNKDDSERYAKFVFWHFRYPAWAQMEFKEWTSQFKLFCRYEGGVYRVTGASRMGDVWLARDLEREHGYDHRVDVAECSDWSPTHHGFSTEEVPQWTVVLLRPTDASAYSDGDGDDGTPYVAHVSAPTVLEAIKAARNECYTRDVKEKFVTAGCKDQYKMLVMFKGKIEPAYFGWQYVGA